MTHQPNQSPDRKGNGRWLPHRHHTLVLIEGKGGGIVWRTLINFVEPIINCIKKWEKNHSFYPLLPWNLIVFFLIKITIVLTIALSKYADDETVYIYNEGTLLLSQYYPNAYEVEMHTLAHTYLYIIHTHILAWLITEKRIRLKVLDKRVHSLETLSSHFNTFLR